MSSASQVRHDADVSGRKRRYVKPTLAFVELEPEERLMLCGKTPNDLACDDPMGGSFQAS